MSRTLKDVAGLVDKRQPFKIASMHAEAFYDMRWTDEFGAVRRGCKLPPPEGWNEVIAPDRGTLYVVYSFETPIAWINEYGQAIRACQWFSQRTARHQGLLWGMKDDEDLTGTPLKRERVKKDAEARHRAYFSRKAEERREKANAKARERRAEQRRQREREIAYRLDYDREEALQRERDRAAQEALDREVQAAIESILTPVTGDALPTTTSLASLASHDAGDG